MPTLTCAEAMVMVFEEVLAADERIVIFGSGFTGVSGNPAALRFAALRDRYPDRFVSPPISELGLAGLGAGAAMSGLRPVVDLNTGSFAFEAFAALANEAAVVHYTSNRQSRVPILYHLHSGIRGAGAEQHSHAPHALFWQTPGLRIVMPGSPADVAGLLRRILRHGQNPTIYVNHYRLLNLKGEVPDGPYEIPLGRAAVKRSGEDATVVACGVMVQRALEAADRLAAEGVSVEVVDPRTLVPLDMDTILASVRKTGRVVTADETPSSCGVAGELLARICERAFSDLKAPPRRVATPDVPIPFSEPLEAYLTPDTDRLVEAVRSVLA